MNDPAMEAFFLDRRAAALGQLPPLQRKEIEARRVRIQQELGRAIAHGVNLETLKLIERDMKKMTPAQLAHYRTFVQITFPMHQPSNSSDSYGVSGLTYWVSNGIVGKSVCSSWRAT